MSPSAKSRRFSATKPTKRRTRSEVPALSSTAAIALPWSALVRTGLRTRRRRSALSAIRARISELHDAETAASVRILYGGSVKPGNIAPIMAQRDVDGALVGGASLDAGQFAQICRYRELAA